MSKSVCDLCGAVGTNKSTCPLNKSAKNPNPSKHNSPQATQQSDKESKHTLNVKLYLNVVGSVEDYDDVGSFPAFNPSQKKLITAWYKKNLLTDIKDFSIRFTGGPFATLSWTAPPPRAGVFSQRDSMVANPNPYDPIKIGGVEYYISARTATPKQKRTLKRDVQLRKLNVNIHLYDDQDQSPALNETHKKLINAWFKKNLSSEYYKPAIKNFKLKFTGGSNATVSWMDTGVYSHAVYDSMVIDPNPYDPIIVNGLKYHVNVRKSN